MKKTLSLLLVLVLVMGSLAACTSGGGGGEGGEPASEAGSTLVLQMYGDIMALLLDHADQVEAVQVWGVTDDLSWRASQYPLLFDAAAQPKPAFWAVVEANEGK